MTGGYCQTSGGVGEWRGTEQRREKLKIPGHGRGSKPASSQHPTSSHHWEGGGEFLDLLIGIWKELFDILTHSVIETLKNSYFLSSPNFFKVNQSRWWRWGKGGVVQVVVVVVVVVVIVVGGGGGTSLFSKVNILVLCQWYNILALSLQTKTLDKKIVGISPTPHQTEIRFSGPAGHTL